MSVIIFVEEYLKVKQNQITGEENLSYVPLFFVSAIPKMPFMPMPFQLLLVSSDVSYFSFLASIQYTEGGKGKVCFVILSVQCLNYF